MAKMTVQIALDMLDIFENRINNVLEAIHLLNFHPEVSLELEQDGYINDAKRDIQNLYKRLKRTTKTKQVSPDDYIKLKALEIKINRIIRKFSFITFVNREEELKQAINLSIPYILVDAPARLGKTFLLLKAKEKLEDQKWFTHYFNFGEHPDACKSINNFLTSLMLSLKDEPAQKGQKARHGAPKGLNIEGALLRKLATEAKENKDKVVIMLDEAEKVDSNIIEKIKQFLYILEKDITDGRHGKFKCIVAGRYVQGWKDTGNIGFNHEILQLTPFTYAYIVDGFEQLGQKSNKGNGLEKENFEIINKLAKIAQMISGGYPESIISMILDMCVNTAGFRSLPENYLERNLKDLFNKHVVPIQRQVLIEIPELSKLFPYLSLIRVYDTKIQIEDKISNWARVNDRLNGSKVIKKDILFKLTDDGLITWNQTRHQYTDSQIRRLFSFQIWMDKPQLAEEINNIAINSYREFLDANNNTDETDHFIACANEYLYHIALSLAHQQPKIGNQHARATMNSEIKWSIDGFAKLLRAKHLRSEWQEDLGTIKRILINDEELQAQIEHFMPVVEYEKTVDNSIKQHRLPRYNQSTRSKHERKLHRA